MAVILTTVNDTLDEFRINTNDISTILGDGDNLLTEFTTVSPKNIINIVKDIDSRFKDVSGDTAAIKAIRKIMSGGYGWVITTDGLEQPLIITYSLGSERVKVVLAWSSTGASAGNVTSAAYQYSGDGGNLFTLVITETITYNSTGIVTGISWS